jgi:hypothetical protein
MGNAQSGAGAPSSPASSPAAPAAATHAGASLPGGHPPIPSFAAGAAAADGAACPVNKSSSSPLMTLMSAGKGGAPGACPVVHEGGSAKASSSSAEHSSSSSSPSASAATNGGNKRSRGPIYNVYSQEIDPTNMMPPPNQSMSPGQRVPLSTNRVQSSIPKGGTESTWLYPSPQMFWNSLVRKGKADGVQETDIDMVIAIHNEMNERTWKQLMFWEEGHKR